ncbi:hypothetical protein Trydic_g1397 [Trypoxylus dichotomus]
MEGEVKDITRKRSRARRRGDDIEDTNGSGRIVLISSYGTKNEQRSSIISSEKREKSRPRVQGKLLPTALWVVAPGILGDVDRRQRRLATSDAANFTENTSPEKGEFALYAFASF